MAQVINNKYLNIFNGKYENDIPNPVFNFDFELDDFQKEANYRISINENVLLCAHTGSGKTVPAIYGIAHAFKNNKKVIYTSPIKTLSNQKYDELKKIFDNVGIMTGDIKKNPEAQCLIMTTEILRNILYRNENSDETDAMKYDIHPSEIGVVIFDEVHYFNDPDRGKVWEETLVLLDRDVSLIMLSATIDKPENFASWIGNMKQKNICLIPTNHRVVPLKHYMLKDKELIPLIENKNFVNFDKISEKYNPIRAEKILNNVAEYLNSNGYTPALFFKYSRVKCEEFAKNIKINLLTSDEMILIKHEFNKLIHKFKETYQHLEQYITVEKLLMKGIAFHHSGLIPILKETVEILYGMGLIKILFATETFAVGVNKPVKTVLFSELEKFDNKGHRYLRHDEYTQMAGRAGRRGIDKVGYVFILPTFKLPDFNSFQNILTGNSPMLKSNFKPTYQFVLKSIDSKKDINNFLNETMLGLEQREEIVVLDGSKQKIEEELNKIDISDELYDNFIECDRINKRLNDTFIKCTKKDATKFKKKLVNIEENTEYIHKLSDIKEKHRLVKEIVSINNQTDYLSNNLNNNIQNSILLLEKNGFIDNNEITLKGSLTTMINECHELIFAELVADGFFDNMDFLSIITCIAVFIDESDRSEDIYLNDLGLDYKLTSCIKHIREKFNHYTNEEESLKLYLNYQEDIHLSFVIPAHIWAKGGHIGDIYNATNMYEGNFVKGILRINNICNNLKDMLAIMNKFETVKRLENSEELLLRDIVTVNSLYVD